MGMSQSPFSALSHALGQDQKSHAGPPLLVALIDGDVLTFSPEHINNGQSGGKHCASQLRAALYAGLDILTDQEADAPAKNSPPSLLIVYLYDQRYMQSRLTKIGHHKAATCVPDFITGLTGCIVVNTPALCRKERLRGEHPLLPFEQRIALAHVLGCLRIHRHIWICSKCNPHIPWWLCP